MANMGYGDLHSCHLCQVSGSVESMFNLMRSDGHRYEEERQRHWVHACMACEGSCLDYKAFIRLGSTAKHVERIVGMGRGGWGLEETGDHFNIQCG